MNEAGQRQVIAALAPMVQHDVNNMMTVTLATLELMRHGLPPGDAALRRIERIDAATSRLDALMRGFLTLARAAPGVVEADVALLLHQLAPALRLMMGGAASLTIAAPAEGVMAPCDAAGFSAALADALRGTGAAAVRLEAGGVVVVCDGATTTVPFAT